MLTVTRLARSCGLSRSTVLYYESIGLLKAAGRSAGNYRRYGEADQARLRQICVYRNAGLKLEDIRALLDGPGGGAATVLERRLAELDAEIEQLREHQLQILKLLSHKPALRRMKVVTKEKWVEVLKACGFSQEDMHRWHTVFEAQAPQEHQEFLEFLHIPAEEIKHIRELSRQGGKK